MLQQTEVLCLQPVIQIKKPQKQRPQDGLCQYFFIFSVLFQLDGHLFMSGLQRFKHRLKNDARKEF